MTDDRPDPYAEHPEESVFPGAGRRVSDEERQAALDAEPAGNATVGDTVDTDAVDSTAHESGVGPTRSPSRSTTTENEVPGGDARWEGAAMTPERLDIEHALPRMQDLASRLWSRKARHHPGQLAWSAAYGEPEALGLGPVFVAGDAWAWLESSDWLEVCGADPVAVRAVVAAALEAGAPEITTSTLETEDVVLSALADAGFAEVEAPWFTHHHLDLDALPPVELPEGDTVRAVRARRARGASRRPSRRLVRDVEGHG